jgi:hypothetical protein
MPKKLKSFTLDEEIYDSLVSMFKRYKARVSISLYINEILKRLLADLKALEDNLQGSSRSVPMDYVIHKMVNEVGKHRTRFLEELKYPEGWEDRLGEKIRTEVERYEMMVETWPMDELDDLQVHYDAEKSGIPYELYKYTIDGWYGLSSDKRYLIEKKTGERYFPVGNTLIKLVREEK